jgi:molecular chaperone DnaK
VDNQPFVPIHVLQGEREMATDNRSLARFELTGIPPAPRGLPKIQVTFRVDANGILDVEAKDLGTGRSQSISVTPTSGLSEQEIDRIVREGEQHTAADAVRRELAELRNQSETLIYTTEQALEGYADLLDPAKAASVKENLDSLRLLLESGAEVDTLREAYATLENATYEIAESIYGDGAS